MQLWVSVTTLGYGGQAEETDEDDQLAKLALHYFSSRGNHGFENSFLSQV